MPKIDFEAIENAIVDANELAQQLTGGIEFQGESRLGEVQLHGMGATGETLANVDLRLAHQIGQELLPRVTGDRFLRIDHRQRRRRDHRLSRTTEEVSRAERIDSLDRQFRVFLRFVDVDVRVGGVAKRTLGQARQRALMTIGEGQSEAIRGESVELIGQSVNRIGEERRLALFAIADHTRTCFLQLLDRRVNRRLPQGVQPIATDHSVTITALSSDQLVRTGNRADLFAGNDNLLAHHSSSFAPRVHAFTFSWVAIVGE